MVDHVKPTQEELDANMAKALEEAEALKSKEGGDEPKPPEDNKEVKKPVETPPTQEEIDYKKRYIASTKEAQILSAKDRKMSEVLDKTYTMPAPTDEELSKEFAEWEDMSDFEKRMAKENLHNKRRFEALGEATKEFKNLDAWQKSVDGFVDDPKNIVSNPLLEGREDEFKLFAMKPTRRGVDMGDLVSAFLFESDTNRPKNKGKMFESGSGGQNNKSTPSGSVSIDEAAKLRKTDYNEYKRLLISGKIQSDL